jgi:hypothetical protein
MPANVAQDRNLMPAIKGQPRTIERRIVRSARYSELPDGSRQRIIITMSVTVSKVSP